MAKRPIKPAKPAGTHTDETQRGGRLTHKPDQPAGKSVTTLMSDTRSFLQSDRFRFIAGLVLLLVVAYLLLAYISAFFTGADDFSILEAADRRAHRAEIRNMAKYSGAAITYFFVNKVFGLPYVILLIMGGLYGCRLFGWLNFKGWKTFFSLTFCLLWSSVMAAFLQGLFRAHTFFQWGGAHGRVIAEWLNSYIGSIGQSLLLVGLFIVFLIIIDPRTIPAFERMGNWVKNLFVRKPKEEVPVEEDLPVADDSQVDIDIADLIDEKSSEQPVRVSGNLIELLDDQPLPKNDGKTPSTGSEIGKNDDIALTIEQTAEEPAAEPQDEPTDESAADESELKPIEDVQSGDDLSQVERPEIADPEDTEMVEKDPDYLLKKLGPFDPRAELSRFQFPSLDLLKVYDNENAPIIDPEEQKANAARIVTTLRSYGVEIESIKATVGPTVTLYEIVPKEGVRISKIQGLENDIMLSLSAMGIRIIAPMPGKGTVGIEVPNVKPQVVSMHSVIASKRFQEEKKMRLPVALGRTITNEVFMFDLAKTPHLIVAGATGQGKSVGLNAIITSLLYKKHPAEMKMVLVDPKMVEFSLYRDLLRHYMAATPDTEDNEIIITDCTKVINTLNSLVIEMENRYKLLMDAKVRNLEDYNEKFINRRLNPEKLVDGSLHHQYLPYIVIVIDEYGDFIMQAGKEVEAPIQRITQKARAVGMHMILATQRPSVQIITGVIKANVPTRIAFRCQSVVDSRTVLDSKGAEQLIGRGDLLYAGGGIDTTRIQCAFVDTPEVEKIVEHVAQQQHYFGAYELPEYVPESGDGGGTLKPGDVDLKHLDSMFADVARYVVRDQQGSTSNIQRKFQIGYNRAGKLSDQLEAAGIVGPNKGPKGREVLIQDDMSLQAVFDRLGVN